MHQKKIVVLGGTGQAGRSIARLLLERTDTSVIIAGRRNPEASLHDLRSMRSEGRITACYADAGKPASLAQVFQGADLVIVTSPSVQYTANIIRACLNAHCDYFDILDSPDAIVTLNQFAQQIEKAGRLFVTQCGLAPGMVAPMVRLAHASLDSLRGARLGLALSLRTAERFEQLYDVFDFIVKSRPMVFERGAWRKKSLNDTTTIDFGHRFGTRHAFAIGMPELDVLPEQLGLEELGLYAATPNRIVDYLLKKLVLGLHKIRPRLGWPTMARLLFRMTQKMVREPSGFIIVLDVWGKQNGQDRSLRVTIEHEDNYYATAVTMVAFVHQYFDGAFKEISGIRMMGHLIDPDRSLKDIQEMGVTVQCEMS